MKQVSIPGCGAFWHNEELLSLVRKNTTLSLWSFNDDLEQKREIISIEGERGYVLDAHDSSIIFSVGSRVFTFDGNSLQAILRAHLPTNFFWHAARNFETLYLQEYGEAPTGIWSYTKGRTRLLITNFQVEKKSRHFHYVQTGPDLNTVFATLGDGNLIRAIQSTDSGETWKPLYKGPWQFVPIAIRDHDVFFGLDSSIAKGGLGNFHMANSKWDFGFFKWANNEFNYPCQFTELRIVEGILVGTLGQPQVAVASIDGGKTWYCVYKESMSNSYSHLMGLAVNKSQVAICTGGSLVLTTCNEIRRICSSFGNPIMTPYKEYFQCVIKAGYKLRRQF